MRYKECIAMILAEGKGEELGSLTDQTAKSIVPFGGKYRIIDFTLSNCAHSGLYSLGVLTQYNFTLLHDYIRNGQTWDFTRPGGGAFMLPSSRCGRIYTGSADSVYQNIDFIEAFNPENVLVLSGDQIYKMDYEQILNFHKQKDADITISGVSVPWDEATCHGIIEKNADGCITGFEDRPINPGSNYASMGIYLFKWSKLKYWLKADHVDRHSSHDFARDLIPTALERGARGYAYDFDGYWRDVGTPLSLWEANMDLLSDSPPIDLYDSDWSILTNSEHRAPCYLASGAEVRRSIVADGCHIYGKLNGSVLFDSVTVEEGAEIIDSVLMPGATVGRGTRVNKAIVGTGVHIGTNAELGADEGIRYYLDESICTDGVTLVGPGVTIERNTRIVKGSHICDYYSPDDTVLGTG